MVKVKPFWFLDISKHYSHKAALEQDLPTATQKLITTNDCILSSVVALTNAAGKVTFFFFTRTIATAKISLAETHTSLQDL